MMILHLANYQYIIYYNIIILLLRTWHLVPFTGLSRITLIVGEQVPHNYKRQTIIFEGEGRKSTFLRQKKLLLILRMGITFFFGGGEGGALACARHFFKHQE